MGGEGQVVCGQCAFCIGQARCSDFNGIARHQAMAVVQAITLSGDCVAHNAARVIVDAVSDDVDCVGLDAQCGVVWIEGLAVVQCANI